MKNKEKMIKEFLNYPLHTSIDASQVERLVAQIHYPDTDLWDGDLSERIWLFQTYQLVYLSPTSIEDYRDYHIDSDRVEDFASLSFEMMPPIIVHPCENQPDSFQIVDGCHRIQTVINQGYPKILALVGYEKCE